MKHDSKRSVNNLISIGFTFDDIAGYEGASRPSVNCAIKLENVFFTPHKNKVKSIMCFYLSRLQNCSKTSVKKFCPEIDIVLKMFCQPAVSYTEKL